MSKAYDRIEWKYLRSLMFQMGFDPSWVKLILNCVSSVTYSFRINNRIVGKISPIRGLRQGDPLSSFLFVLCVLGISDIINSYADNNMIHIVRVACGSPMITPLFFADDNLVFFKTFKEECNTIKSFLKYYKKASGQLINFDKSVITFSTNTPQYSIHYIKNCLHMQVCQGHLRSAADGIESGPSTFHLRSRFSFERWLTMQWPLKPIL